MGQMHNFVCLECGYEAEVIDEGKDGGMGLVLVTISCADCQVLYNVEPEGDLWRLVLSRIPFNPIGIACPRDPSHRVRPWTDPWPCPVCGGEMKNDGTLKCDWD